MSSADELVAVAGAVAAGALAYTACSSGTWAACACAAAATAASWSLLALAVELRTFAPFEPAARRRHGLGRTRWSASDMSIGVDVIVIGSGMAGLSCASTLSAAGQRVLVLERHEVVGGGAHTYAVDGKSGWKFDSGLHYTIPQAAALLALAAGRARSPVAVERMGERMAEGNVYDRIVLAGSGDAELRIATDKQVLAELKRRFPTRAAELDRFMAVCAGLLWRFPLWCLSALLPSRFRRLALGSPLFAHWRAWASRTAEAALRDLLPGDDEDSRRLRGYLSGLWIDGGCPPSRMSFFLLAATTVGFPHEGGAYPTGGSEAMALALVEAIEARGGAVRVRAHVSRVLVDGGVARGVQLADGSRVYAPIVVSATGYRMTAGARCLWGQGAFAGRGLLRAGGLWGCKHRPLERGGGVRAGGGM